MAVRNENGLRDRLTTSEPELGIQSIIHVFALHKTYVHAHVHSTENE